MKRYFVVPPKMLPGLPDELPTHPDLGEYHYVDLDSHAGGLGHGYRVLVMMDGTKAPHESWEELPHLLDAQTTLEHPKHAYHFALLEHLRSEDDKGNKLQPLKSHSGYHLAQVLRWIHPLFKP